MKVYKTQSEVELDITKNGYLILSEDTYFDCSISIEASIMRKDIKKVNIYGKSISCRHIVANSIIVDYIKSLDIVSFGDIIAKNINSWNIFTYGIKAYEINVLDISYDYLCVALNKISYTRIESRSNCDYISPTTQIKSRHLFHHSFMDNYANLCLGYFDVDI